MNRPVTLCRQGTGNNLAFIVSGPSGAGKTSVIECVMDQLPGLAFSVSYTTRKPRPDERHGVDYYYISPPEFKQLLQDGDLLEYVTYQDDAYGTSRSHIQQLFEEGKDVILNVDVEGAKHIQQQALVNSSVVYIFFSPSSLKILEDRLEKRGTEDSQEMSGRLRTASQEMAQLSVFEYLVINDDLGQAVDELRSIIIAERCKLQ